MDTRIKKIIDKCRNLSMKLNVGERHRIMHSEVKTGSLWIEVQQETYRVKVTGEVRRQLQKFLRERTGLEPSFDQGNPVWHIPELDDVTAIIMSFERL